MPSEENQLLFDLGSREDEAAHNLLIDRISRDPLQFMSNPDLSGISDRHFWHAYEYFMSPHQDRLTFSVCTRVFDKDTPKIQAQLKEWEYADDRFRCFPFVYGGSPEKNQPRTIERVKSELAKFWNTDSSVIFGTSSRVIDPILSQQNGLLSILDAKRVGDFYLFRCSTPTPPALCRPDEHTPSKYHGSFVIAYDVLGGAFYTINSRIKCFTNEHTFIEIISPDIQPPDVHELLSHPGACRVKALLVLDYHIGDSLSLLSTHARYLSRIAHLDLTIDISRCRFLADERKLVKSALFPAGKVNIISEIPDYRKFDLIFDPYDLIPGQFAKKPQNDSCAFSILSGLEFGHAKLKHVRRDILDIHMTSLRYWGVVPRDASRPPFAELGFASPETRKAQRDAYRTKLLRGISGKRNVILFFPFGLTQDRHYPPPRMRAVVEHFYNRGAVLVFAGSEADTSRIYESTVSRSEALKGRIKKLAGRRLREVIAAILASDVVVAMDTGTLHLSRTLRTKPLGLYTKKVLSIDEMMRFPWYVDDGTVLQLHPDRGDHHVSVKVLIEAIEDRLDALFAANGNDDCFSDKAALN